MIKVRIKKTDNLIDEITIKGHANFADIGYDIVCASVSSIVITSINAALKLDEYCLEYEDADGFIKIKMLKHDNVTKTLVNNMIDLLKELKIKYPKNINVN